MFYIFNKQKIYSYLVASTTIVILLAVSIFFSRDRNKSVETWASSDNNSLINNIQINGRNILIVTEKELNSNEIKCVINAIENV